MTDEPLVSQMAFWPFCGSCVNFSIHEGLLQSSWLFKNVGMALQRHYPLSSSTRKWQPVTSQRHVANQSFQAVLLSINIYCWYLSSAFKASFVRGLADFLGKIKTKIQIISALTVCTVTKITHPFQQRIHIFLLFHYKLNSSSCPIHSLQILAPAELFFLASSYNFQLFSACLGSKFQNSFFEPPLNSFHLLCTVLLLQSSHELPA